MPSTWGIFVAAIIPEMGWGQPGLDGLGEVKQRLGATWESHTGQAECTQETIWPIRAQS